MSDYLILLHLMKEVTRGLDLIVTSRKKNVGSLRKILRDTTELLQQNEIIKVKMITFRQQVSNTKLDKRLFSTTTISDLGFIFVARKTTFNKTYRPGKQLSL